MSDEFMGTTSTQSAETSQPAVEAKTVEQPRSDYSDFLQAITNAEGKPKYKSVPDALIGAAKAQEHIARLEAENAEIRKVLTKVDTMEAVLAKLETGSRADPPAAPRVEDQEKLVLSVMERAETAKREQANRESVLMTLKEKFGDKTNEALAAKANDLGLSVADLGAMASRSPKAVLAYFQAEGKGTPTVQGTVNTQALQPTAQEVKAPQNIMWGASSRELTDYFRQIKGEVNKQYGIN